jgi:Right handed beta helix region/Pectate lyase superfamily protein
MVPTLRGPALASNRVGVTKRFLRREIVYAFLALSLVLCQGQAAETDRLPDYSRWPVLNVKLAGAVGDGVTDDSQAFATTLQRAGNFLRAVIYLPPGIYYLNSAKTKRSWGGARFSILALPNARLVIKGSSAKECRLVVPSESILFQGLDSPQADLTLIDFALECRSGFSTGYESIGVLFTGRSLRAQKVEFRNWKAAIRIPEGLTAPVSSLWIQSCTFLYDYGRAGVAQQDPTYQDPVTSILGAGLRTHLYDCHFNGLVDPTFRDVSRDKNTGQPVPANQYTPADGLIKTINQAQSVVIKGCTIRNNGVESLAIDGNGKEVTFPPRIEVTNNTIFGPDPGYRVYGTGRPPRRGQVQTLYTDYYPLTAGVIANGVTGIIAGNRIVNEAIGVGVGNENFPFQAVTINENQIEGCKEGIRVSQGKVARNLAISSNSISFHRAFTMDERRSSEAAGTCGIWLDHCSTAQVINNTIQLNHENWWSGEITLAQDLRPGASAVSVLGPLPQSELINFYIGEYPDSIFIIGRSDQPGEIRLNSNPLSKSIPSGASLKWYQNAHQAGNWFEGACIMNYASQRIVSRNNVFRGGFYSIRTANEAASVRSVGDHFCGYLFSPSFSGSVTLE